MNASVKGNASGAGALHSLAQKADEREQKCPTMGKPTGLSPSGQTPQGMGHRTAGLSSAAFGAASWELEMFRTVRLAVNVPQVDWRWFIFWGKAKCFV